MAISLKRRHCRQVEVMSQTSENMPEHDLIDSFRLRTCF